MQVKAALIIWLAAGSAVVAVSVKKCCREGESVRADVNEDNSLSSSTHFSCVEGSSEEVKVKIRRNQKDKVALSPSHVNQVSGHNLLIDSETHWPACGGSSLVAHNLNQRNNMSPSASCIDVMYSAYFVFTCEEHTRRANDSVEVFRVKKCCDVGFGYDIFSRSCVANNETNDFRALLRDKIVAFEPGLPGCRSDEVLVEYHSHVHRLRMFDNSLIISSTNRPGPAVLNSFCVETTVNLTVDFIDDEQLHPGTLSKFIAKVCRPRNEVCNEIPCVRKCCAEGLRMSYDNETSHCEPHESHLNVKFYDFDFTQSPEEPNAIEPSEFGILTSLSCFKYMLDVDEGEMHYHSGIDGSLFIPETSDKNFHSNDNYCVDYYKGEDFKSTDVIQVKTFVCFDEEATEKVRVKFKIYATLLAISATFLGATFLVYIMLPKLLNLHGKTTVCHVLSLFVGYTFLSVVQFHTEYGLTHCKVIGYIVYFSLLSAFSWLNIMCVDIFWTIGSIRMAHGMQRLKEVKRFMCYSLYAWGLPCVATLLTFLADDYIIPEEYASFKPKIGKDSCWFSTGTGKYGHWIFFMLPVALQTTVNIVLFIITAIRCNRVKREIHRMQMNDSCEENRRRYLTDKSILLMNLKLFIVMGISWLLEIIATFGSYDQYWWFLSDVFNLLQGVLIFAIFVLKKSVLVAIRKKLGIRKLGLRGVSTTTNMSSLDLHSTSVSKHNGKMIKSNSSSTLTNSNVRT